MTCQKFFELRCSDIKRLIPAIGLTLMLAGPQTLWAAEKCPQPRKTPAAPAEFLKKTNPLPASEANLKAGELIYQEKAKPIACKTCHGEKGDGQSQSGFESKPVPRNFACAKTMKPLTDGQLFWIIRKGSPRTAMFAFPSLSDDQIWQLVHYLRGFSKP